MNYAQPLSNQIIVFIRSVGLGVLLGFIYEVFCVLRGLISDKRWAYILCDLSFSLAATLISFFFMVLYNDGTVRLNLIVAQLMGGAAFHLSAGAHIAKPLIFIGQRLRRAVLLVLHPLKIIYKKCAVILGKLKIRVHCNPETKKHKKKINNIIKIPLKNSKK